MGKASASTKQDTNTSASPPASVPAVAQTVAPAIVAPAAQSTEIVVPAEHAMMEQFAGSGLENVTSRDVLIPRLTIIQQLSDQMKKTKAAYIEGAEVGDILDTSTNEIIERPLYFLPVIFVKVWIEWWPRASGKGIANIFTEEPAPELLLRAENSQVTMRANGNLCAETAQVYGMNLSQGRRPAFISFASTQLKKSRRWMTLAQAERLQRRDGSEYIPPLFYRSYKIDTITEVNNQGDWSGWKIERDAALPELPRWQQLMTDAVAFRDSVIAGSVRGDMSNMTDDPTTIQGEGSTVSEQRM